MEGNGSAPEILDPASWFVDKARTDYFTIENPRDRSTAQVTVRMLDAGDKAEISEIALEEAGGRISLARQRLEEVQRCLVSWTIPGGPPTPELIRRLPPPVLEQIHNGYKLLEGGIEIDRDVPLDRQSSGGSSGTSPRETEPAAIGSSSRDEHSHEDVG